MIFARTEHLFVLILDAFETGYLQFQQQRLFSYLTTTHMLVLHESIRVEHFVIFIYMM